jgi:hypothetical protein
MYPKQIGRGDQAAFAARGFGQDAGSESFKESEARNQNLTASDGTVLCEGDVVRL